MNIGVYGLLFVFAAFIILLIRNPSMSCFGKKLRSPFYPLLRRKRIARDAERLKEARRKTLATSDYGFKLGQEAGPRTAVSPEAKAKAEDYGFKLDD